MSQHCWAQHVACVWPACCNMLGRVGCCWLKFDHFQTWANNTHHVSTHRNTVAKRTQYVAPNNVATCCVDMLRSFGRGLRIAFFKTHFANEILKVFLTSFLVDNFSITPTAATWIESQLTWNAHLPLCTCKFFRLLIKDGYTYMCRILQCLYMKLNGDSREHRWRTHRYLRVIRDRAKKH